MVFFLFKFLFSCYFYRDDFVPATKTEEKRGNMVEEEKRNETRLLFERFEWRTYFPELWETSWPLLFAEDASVRRESL